MYMSTNQDSSERAVNQTGFKHPIILYMLKLSSLQIHNEQILFKRISQLNKISFQVGKLEKDKCFYFHVIKIPKTSTG